MQNNITKREFLAGKLTNQIAFRKIIHKNSQQDVFQTRCKGIYSQKNSIYSLLKSSKSVTRNTMKSSFIIPG